MSRPTAVEPVNAILPTAGGECAPDALPRADQHGEQPFLQAGVIGDRLQLRAVSGVSSDGLWMTASPAAGAGAIFHLAIVSGKFHGVITPTTPIGSRNVMSTPPATGTVCPPSRFGTSA